MNSLRSDFSWTRIALLGGAMFVCLGAFVGGEWGWKIHKEKHLETLLSDHYFLAIDGKDSQKNLENIVKAKPEKIREYASLRLGDLYRKEHLDAQAKSILSQDSFRQNSLKGLALFMALNLRSVQLEEAYSDRDLSELREGYQGLARTYPEWGDFSREGLIALDLRGDKPSEEKKAEATRLLKEILSSSTAPSGMRQRASLLLQALES
ncbi:hypothetical protein FAI40_00290 [Acetobacteraceae bacterium]|nr:hypothetical protein FAI40_00290 [Acetobacteraceae bacterium]